MRALLLTPLAFVACAPSYRPPHGGGGSGPVDIHDPNAMVDYALHDPDGFTKAIHEATQAKVNGAIDVDERPVPIAGCTSGQLEYFHGIDVQSLDGRKLRLVNEVDGSTSLYLFPAGGATVTPIKGCAAMTMERAGIAIGHVDVVEGQVTLSCTTTTPKIVGSFTYQCAK